VKVSKSLVPLQLLLLLKQLIQLAIKAMLISSALVIYMFGALPKVSGRM
jgi:hypothetical protein